MNLHAGNIVLNYLPSELVMKNIYGYQFAMKGLTAAHLWSDANL